MAEQEPSSMLNYRNPSDYWKSRNFHDSERLHIQHWLFLRQLGYLLHPSIPQAATNGSGLRIADLGCANGAFLIDLLSQLPQARFDGFDITTAHFTAEQFLPANVTLTQLDILGPIPEHLHGAFDIVTVRAFTTCIVEGNTTPFLQAARKLLKPGGYLQWIEATTPKMHAVSPDSSTISTSNCDALAKFFAARYNGGDEANFAWLWDIPAHLAREGFEVLHNEFSEIPTVLFKGWTDNLMNLFERVVMGLPETVPEEDRKRGNAMSRGEYEVLWEGVMGETEKGVAFTLGELIVNVGRKVGE